LKRSYFKKSCQTYHFWQFLQQHRRILHAVQKRRPRLWFYSVLAVCVV